MPFGNKAMPVRIWSFKADAPHEGLELVEQQMLLEHRYKNVLIALEQERRYACQGASYLGTTPR